MATPKKTKPARARSAAQPVRPMRKKPGRKTALAAPPPSDSAVFRLVRQVREWTDSLLNISVAATDITITLARQRISSPEQKDMLKKTGDLLRNARKTAGLSLEELGKAVDLQDPVLLDLAENGKAALPFEIILRLTSILGRKDPVVFFLNLTRSYNPKLWKIIEDLGFGRLLVQAGREREFANIYRACDDARELSDQEFARVLAFVQSAFSMAMAFSAREQAEA
ncbi:helix-turn-helix domain-containing protein [Noviherbaspirillum autotrophicum]|uniref:helix-turn-helix domain-containing protein n=1 Tax=Noviherbaspirillum autotrophicum TaxID=709839 RepID=UPI0006937EA0|nr:helix-turn-helix transcriptional regulator [Noviherbaspirillum autotrophicum]